MRSGEAVHAYGEAHRATNSRPTAWLRVQEDLMNDGVVGLMDSLNRFDPSNGVSFLTFAKKRIHGAIMDAMRSNDWVSRGARKRARELHQCEERLAHRWGADPICKS